MSITKHDIRIIVRQEIERGLTLLMEAKTTATAIEKGQFYTDAPSLSHNKSHLRKQSSLRGSG